MADLVKVKTICDEIEVSPEESLFYLEGFDWNLASAMEACRIKTLPSVKVKSSPEISVSEQLPPVKVQPSPEVSVIEKSTAVNYSPKPIKILPARKRPRLIGSSGSLNLNPRTDPPLDEQKECIDQFRGMGFALPLQEVVHLLRMSNWNVQVAINHFIEPQVPPKHVPEEYDGDDDDDDDDVIPMYDPSYLKRLQEGQIPMIGVSNLEGFSADETSTALAMDMMENKGPPLPTLLVPSQSHSHASVGFRGEAGSSSSSSMNVEADEGLIHVPVTYSSQVQIQGSSSSAQVREEPPPPYKVDRICNETGVCREEALYYLEGYDWDLASAMEACRTKTFPPLKLKSLPGVSANEIAAAPEWESPSSRPPLVINSDQISNEMRIHPVQQPPKNVDLLLQKNDGDIESFCHITRASRGEAVVYFNNCEWNLAEAMDSYMEKHFGSPQSIPQSQASGSSSSSLKTNDPTETKETLKEGSDESVTVAITPKASSQVDRKLKGKAVEEDSSMGTLPDPSAIQDRTTVGRPQAEPTTITVSIVLADGHSGTTIEIPFRSNQTIRDIRNAIDERTPDSNRDYELQSKAEGVCSDLNKTIDRFCVDGSPPTFIQIVPDL